jgi:hypothetical protein
MLLVAGCARDKYDLPDAEVRAKGRPVAPPLVMKGPNREEVKAEVFKPGDRLPDGRIADRETRLLRLPMPKSP